MAPVDVSAFSGIEVEGVFSWFFVATTSSAIGGDTVDGSEIQRAPVELGRVSQY